jgi:alpha-beta hydrolase superfamily lysophospholipase
MTAAGGPALAAAARAGEELRYNGTAPDKALAEGMLEVPTGVLYAAAERNDAVAVVGLAGAIERLEHEWVPYSGQLVHLELQRVGEGAPTIVIAHGLGDHVRRHTPLAAALAERGYNTLSVDRTGHGLSEGRRGDAPLEADIGVLELAIALARARSSGPVVLLGDSLGGILGWYLLTREPDIDAAVCHCIGHPDVHPDPSYRFKEPLVRALGRLAPQAPISVRQIADYDHVALDPETKRYFDDRVDRLFNFTVSARSASSYLGFRPGVAWEELETPALVLIGAEDRLVTPEFTRRAFERARPPRAEYVEVPGAGHQLFLDDLGASLPPLVEWLERTVAN